MFGAEDGNAPAVMVMGDFNDGPGKELLERNYMTMDLMTSLQSSLLDPAGALGHVLAASPAADRWTAYFKDYLDPARDPHILLDNILSTQALAAGNGPWRIVPGSGQVEHQAHEAANQGRIGSDWTSDHRPVSVVVEV